MKFEQYDAALKAARDLFTKKNQDYNSAVKLEDYFPLGDASYVQMLHVKMLRLRSLVEADPDTAPNFESLADTCLDMINYAAFYYAFLVGEP